MNMLKPIFAGLLLMTSALLHAQTADEVINKHIAAIGGKDVIMKITSQVAESDLTVMGTPLTSKTYVLVGKGYRNEASLNGQDIIQVVTPTGGWMINPLAGMTEAQALPEDQVKDAQSSFDLGGDLFNYKEKGNKVELAGTASVDRVTNAIRLKLTNKEGKETMYYLDPATHYVVRTEAKENVNGQEIDTYTSFSNFKKTDVGYVMPYSIVANRGIEISMTITKVEFNKEIDPKIFEMPK
jgi:outer membrane lipoprotein-sorting protein